jgi:uncharacterized membrane protein YhaH (DUF805 family)
MHWYTDVVFKKYAVFSGRAGRPEFWWFQLANILVSIAVAIVGAIVFGSGNSALSDIYSLAVFLPSLAVQMRRLHDTDRSGWWLLLWFVLVIGWIVLIVFYILPGTRGANRFGESPDGEISSADGVQPLAPPAGQRYCSTCGAAHEPGAAFCGNCGAAQPS